MNTISSTLKDEIKKSKDSKHKEKIKFISSILVTNILVALLCYRSPQSDSPKNSSKKTLHTHYQMIVIPLTTLVSDKSESETETPVTLVSKDQKIIAEKAYLHNLTKTVDGLTHFKIELNDKDIVKVSEFIESGVVAIPFVERKKSKVAHKKGSKYEISI